MDSPSIEYDDENFENEIIEIDGNMKIEEDDSSVEYCLDENVEYYVEEELILNDEDAQPEIFHCNKCDTQFHSVEEHIRELHAEEDDVQIQVPDEADDGDESNGHQDKLDKIPKSIFADDHNDNDEETFEVEILNSPHICSECAEVFETRGSLKYHMRSHKPSIVPFSFRRNICPILKSTSKPFGVKNKKANTSPSPSSSVDASNNELLNHICEVCNTTFMSSKSLKLHLRMHKPVKPKTLQQARLQQPGMDEENAKAKSTFFCDICKKSYDLDFKEIHMQTHNGDTKFRCTACNITFATKALLDMHMAAKQAPRVIQTKAAQNNIRLPYACQYCSKEFARPHEKVKHERIHTGEKPYACEICGKTFRVTYCLTLHMRTHTDVRPYVCPHCNKRYKAPSVYNHHLLTHSDVRAFQCPFCPKAFKTHVQLSGHKNSHLKPFACTECNRPFSTLFAVKAHMESHKKSTHSLKHSCAQCGASYTRAFALKNHVQEQHPDAPLNDDVLLLENVDQLDDEELQTGLYIINMDQDEDQLQGELMEEVTIISEADQFIKEEIVTDWLK